MTLLIGLLIGGAVGSILGFFLAALLTMGKIADMQAEQEFHRNWGHPEDWQ